MEKKFHWVELNENGCVINLYFDATEPPEGGIFVKVEDNPYQYIGKQYVNGVFVEVEQEVVEPAPSQLDRIESAINKSQEEIAQEARDAYTLELIEGGVIQ